MPEIDIILTFGTPRNVSHPREDATTVRFPYSVTSIREGALKDTISEHSVDVSISGTQQSIWGFGRTGEAGSALTKILFHIALDEILPAVKAGRGLDQQKKIQLTTQSEETTNPYDPLKIPWPKGYTISLKQVVGAPSKSDLIAAFEKIINLGITLTWTKSGLLMGTRQSVDPSTLSDVARTEVSMLEDALANHRDWTKIRLEADDQGYDLELKALGPDGQLRLVPRDRRAAAAAKLRPVDLQL